MDPEAVVARMGELAARVRGLQVQRRRLMSYSALLLHGDAYPSGQRRIVLGELEPRPARNAGDRLAYSLRARR